MIQINLTPAEQLKLMSAHFKVKEWEILKLAGINKGNWSFYKKNVDLQSSKEAFKAVDKLFHDCLSHWEDAEWLKKQVK